VNDDRAVEDDLRTALSGEERSVVEPAGLADRLVEHAQRPARRHRIRWRATGWLPLVASAAALVIVATGVAVTRSALSQPHHTPGTSVPLPSRTDSAPASPAPSSSVPSSTAPSSPTRSSAVRPSSPAGSATSRRSGGTPPPSGTGPWSAPQLLITESSLGAVQRGMTNDAAQRAAGVTLGGIGDGIVRPTDASIGGSTQLQYSWGTTCFDAFRSHGGSGTRVITSAGIALGDPMSRVRSAYPNATPFTADPNWGGPGNVKGGLLVRFHDGVLLFVGTSPDRRGGRISSIRGAPTARTASSYFC